MNRIEDDLRDALRRKPAPSGLAPIVFARIESRPLNTKAPRRLFRSWTQGTFQNGILAFASAALLALGITLHLGESQSVLANSIEQIKVITTVSARLHRVTSMDCLVMTSDLSGKTSQFRLRWNTSGITRIDEGPANREAQPQWITKDTVFTAGNENLSMRAASEEYQTPAILARNIEHRYALRQSERRELQKPDSLLLIGRDGSQDVEILIDTQTYLPITLKKYSRHSDGPSGVRHCISDARFLWNHPLPAELFHSRASTAD